MLRKVISGGQTGADQAGLMVAKKYNVETGGWIPKGFWTIFGPAPELADYGLKETASTNYPSRTKRNVEGSDGTVRLASTFATAGEKLTLKYINEFGKPYHDVHLDGRQLQEKGYALGEWVVKNNIAVLNVAGNADRAKVYGDHFYASRTVLTAMFDYLREHNQLQVLP